MKFTPFVSLFMPTCCGPFSDCKDMNKTCKNCPEWAARGYCHITATETISRKCVRRVVASAAMAVLTVANEVF